MNDWRPTSEEVKIWGKKSAENVKLLSSHVLRGAGLPAACFPCKFLHSCPFEVSGMQSFHPSTHASTAEEPLADRRLGARVNCDQRHGAPVEVKKLCARTTIY